MRLSLSWSLAIRQSFRPFGRTCPLFEKDACEQLVSHSSANAQFLASVFGSFISHNLLGISKLIMANVLLHWELVIML